MEEKKKYIVKEYRLIDVLNGNKTRFNVNNLWESDGKPDDYELIQELGNTRHWINLFHNNVQVLTLDTQDLQWMQEAFKIGGITGKFPKKTKRI